MCFTAWTKREKSVENFANRILEKYGNRRGSVNKQVVILYGNWAMQGAQPEPAKLAYLGFRS